MSVNSLIQRIDALLPQTQCTKCGYEGCLPYAEALANGLALINRCPPGGDAGIGLLANALDTAILPLDTSCGVHEPLKVAVIDEQHCIGCMICIRACPVDAIIGANKRMHTVLDDWCTGCDLCVAPCPVDCISMEPASRDWSERDAGLARYRHQQHKQRVQRDAADNASLMNDSPSTPMPAPGTSPTVDEDRKRAAIDAALARARARRNS